MAFEYWVYPGASLTVNTQTLTSMVKVTVDVQPVGALPPEGAVTIPPQTPHAAAIQAGAQAMLDVAREGMTSAQAMSDQHAQQAQAALEAAIAKTNEDAAKVAAKAAIPTHAPGAGPSWEITLTEKR